MYVCLKLHTLTAFLVCTYRDVKESKDRLEQMGGLETRYPNAATVAFLIQRDPTFKKMHFEKGDTNLRTKNIS